MQCLENLPTTCTATINGKPDFLPAEMLFHSPKISKGENYKGLPYVMLDYPRCFGKTDIFAIRQCSGGGIFSGDPASERKI